MSHTPPIPLKQGKNSVGYYSIDQPNNLVVFVHGFNGKAIDTWECFPELIRSTQDFNNCDILFYGYDSLKGQVNNNAVRFYEFLKRSVETAVRPVTDTIPGYQKIILVAHSLGSIVVRRSLLNAKDENRPWIEKCRMVLFAPAHRGARVQKLVIETLPLVGRVLGGLGMLSVPVLDDLRPDSETITNLIKDTKAYIDAQEGQFSIAHTVVWAAQEIIVHNERFCEDPVAKLIEGKSHTTLCKPVKSKYDDPLHIVTAAL